MLPDELGHTLLNHIKQVCSNKTMNHSWSPELLSMNMFLFQSFSSKFRVEDPEELFKCLDGNLTV